MFEAGLAGGKQVCVCVCVCVCACACDIPISLRLSALIMCVMRAVRFHEVFSFHLQRLILTSGCLPSLRGVCVLTTTQLDRAHSEACRAGLARMLARMGDIKRCDQFPATCLIPPTLPATLQPLLSCISDR
jgi:hypothetical protein